ncbi:sigma-70 family RNA polymerase sigma factor [Jeotgalibacillus campisalis]|uniref:RNA polymerase sigma factor n=1 Tax=Jeotgalibacillus campisalis TaxID=220754 RepID=A0A0C2RR52_9BACL|nr:sigma-70 family RNA polymerase sigma factor [Jeotgalibacillus campisalis]KIL52750.1 RNA polymerase sigma factor [Jeotgalibacillus campisalis]
METIDLVKRAMNGDEKAFETLIRNEHEKLFKTAFLYVRNKDDALDVIQETVYKAFVSVDKLKQPEYFTTWLTKILIRTTYEVLKKKDKIVLFDHELEKIQATCRSDIEGEMDLTTAISMLKHHYQTVIILFYYHDYSIRSIAETIDKPENTVKTYLRRARLELKQIIEGVKTHEKGATR